MRTNHFSCGTHTEMGSHEFEDVDDHSQWPRVSADMRGQPDIQVELEDLTQKIRDAGLEQSRRSSEFAKMLKGLSADISQSDERVAAVEASLLRAREENNELIGYLEGIYSRLTALDLRFESVKDFESAREEHPQRAEFEELRTDLQDGLARSRAAQMADLERVELRVTSLPTTDDVIELISRLDVRIAGLARSEDLTTLGESIDSRLLDLAGEHGTTRELATMATSLSVALTGRLKAQEEGLTERVSEEFRTIRNEVRESLTDVQRSHMDTLEQIELRLAGLPTTEDVIALGADIDLRMNDLARADKVEARYQSLDKSLLTQLSLVRAELLAALKTARESQAYEIQQIEISLATLPSTEDVLAISTRLDETELLVSVRALKQIGELREELQSALETTRNESKHEVAALETRMAGLPSLDDLSAADRRVDNRLAVVPTADDLAALARRIDQRIDDLRERTEDSNVLAEKAKARADYGSDAMFEAQVDLREIDELRGRPVEESLRDAGGEDSDVWLSSEIFGADPQATAIRRESPLAALPPEEADPQ